MSDIKEKISALYDGEIDQSEIDDLLEIINNDKRNLEINNNENLNFSKNIVIKDLTYKYQEKSQNISFEYLKPHMNQCKNCHQVFEGYNKRISPLSFFPKYLNFEIFTDTIDVKNQLIHLVDHNFLDKNFILEAFKQKDINSLDNKQLISNYNYDKLIKFRQFY